MVLDQAHDLKYFQQWVRREANDKNTNEQFMTNNSSEWFTMG